MFNPLFGLIPFLLLLLAIVLIILIKKIKPQGMLKKFLILAGVSVAGFFISVLLHNLISGLLSQLLKKEIEEPVFFILATIICPLGLMAGVIGSIIQLIKERGKFKPRQ